MKKYLRIFLLVLSFVVVICYAFPHVFPECEAEELALAEDYELVFSDEFDLPDGSQPDSTKWRRSPRNISISARWRSNSKDVVYIKDGCLVCRAIPNRKEPGDTALMLTGSVDTRDTYAFKYGKIEVRMKTNKKRGNFPAAWMSAKYVDGDERYGEIDIVEMFGKMPHVYHTAHTEMTFRLHKKGPRRSFDEKIDFTKWHVYGVVWTENTIVWTVDGKQVGIYKRIDTPQMIADGQWTFDRPFFILLNQSVGDGSHEKLQYPHVKQVYETRFDWIRVYQARR